MDTARITEIPTDPVTVDLVERQPIMQIAYAPRPADRPHHRCLSAAVLPGGPGTAELREEDDVPDGYLQASFRTMPQDQHAGFEEQVRAVRLNGAHRDHPTWVRLNGFQRTAPRAVERLVRAKQG